MTHQKDKRSGYLQDALQEAERIISQAEDESEAIPQIQALLENKIVGSFKNGIAVGMKKAGKIK